MIFLFPDFYNECELPCSKAKGSSLRFSNNLSPKRSASNVWLYSDPPTPKSSTTSRKSSFKKGSVSYDESSIATNQQRMSCKKSRSNLWLVDEPESRRPSIVSARSGRRPTSVRLSNNNIWVSDDVQSPRPSVVETKTSLRRAQAHRKPSSVDMMKLAESISRMSLGYESRLLDGETIVIRDAEVTIRPKSKVETLKEPRSESRIKRYPMQRQRPNLNTSSSNTDTGAVLEGKSTSKDLVHNPMKFSKSSPKRSFSARPKPRPSPPGKNKMVKSREHARPSLGFPTRYIRTAPAEGSTGELIRTFLSF